MRYVHCLFRLETEHHFPGPLWPDLALINQVATDVEPLPDTGWSWVSRGHGRCGAADIPITWWSQEERDPNMFHTFHRIPHMSQTCLRHPDLITLYLYVRETGGLTNFLNKVCFATQNLDGEKNQCAAKITKPPPAPHMKITKPQPCAGFNLAST